MLRCQILGLIYKAILARDKTHGTRFILYWNDHFVCTPSSMLGTMPPSYIATLNLPILWDGFTSNTWTQIEAKAADFLKSKGLL